MRDPGKPSGLLAAAGSGIQKRGEGSGPDADAAATKEVPPRCHLLVLLAWIHGGLSVLFARDRFIGVEEHTEHIGVGSEIDTI